jgi:hypothetical protein
MATKRPGKSSKKRLPAKKKPKTKLPRKISLSARGGRGRAPDWPNRTRFLPDFGSGPDTPPVLKAATGGPTAGTAPTNAASSPNIVPPAGELNIQGTASIVEASNVMDTIDAVVTKPKVLEALDVIDADLTQAAKIAQVLTALRADSTYNGAGQLPLLMEWHISVAFKASAIIRDHANGKEQRSPVLDLALSVLENIGYVVVEAFKWAADFVKIAGATALGTAAAVWTPQQWHDAAVTLSKTVESFRGFF